MDDPFAVQAVLDQILKSNMLPAKSYSGRELFIVRYIHQFKCRECGKKILSGTIAYSGGHGNKICFECLKRITGF